MRLKINNEKVLKKIAREFAFERNGGGQFVCLNRPHKNKKKYDRKENKREARLASLYYFHLSYCCLSPSIFT